MYINRGNHETKEMNRTYGFEGEAKHKHGEQTYKVLDHKLIFTDTVGLNTSAGSCSPNSSQLVSPGPVTCSETRIDFDASDSASSDPHLRDSASDRSETHGAVVTRGQEALLRCAWRFVQQR